VCVSKEDQKRYLGINVIDSCSCSNTKYVNYSENTIKNNEN